MKTRSLVSPCGYEAVGYFADGAIAHVTYVEDASPPYIDGVLTLNDKVLSVLEPSEPGEGDTFTGEYVFSTESEDYIFIVEGREEK